jgi:hypothetical protein
MPNWCVQNCLLRGPREDVARFCDAVNSLINKPDVRPNGFGKFWLGNVCEAFGYRYDELERTNARLRGNLDPDGEAFPTLFHPEAETVPFKSTTLDADTAEVRFSVTTAWGPSDWFNGIIKEQFRACSYSWQATDEFGNFHTCHNPELLGLKSYEVEQCCEDFVCFEKGEEKEAAAHLEKLTGVPFTFEDILLGEDHVCGKLSKWNEEHVDNEVYFRFWEEE